MANLPTPTFEIAFATDPGAAPTWTDVSSFARGRFSVRRGAQHENDRVEAGTGTLLLDNLDRRFDPTNASSPYYPNVLPMRRARIRATWDSITYNVITGYIESWPQTYPGIKDSVVESAIADGFKVLALKDISATYVAQASGTRVGAVLDEAGWPSADRAVAAGISTIPAATVTGKTLEYLQKVSEAEGGKLFCSRDGKITFQDRETPFAGGSSYDYSVVTWGDGGGSEIPYQDVVLVFDDTDIVNDSRVTREDGTEQVVTDPASETKYLPRSKSLTGVLLPTDADALDLANFNLYRYKEPELRITSLVSNPMKTNAWAATLAREIGDKILVRKTPPGGGAAISQKSFIEGISHDFTPGGPWIVTFAVSPAVRALDFWQLGDPVMGVLDQTTRVAR